ncbi:MAG: hypothetical protein ACHQC9_01485 [Alphaproteobacteria bacterium]
MQSKITKRALDGVGPRVATYLVRDTEVKGFVLLVTPAGAKSMRSITAPARAAVRRSGG